MKNNSSIVYSFLLVVGDFFALAAAFASAYVLRFRILNPELATGNSGRLFFYAVLGTLPLWIMVHALIGLYRQEVFEKRFTELGRLLVGSLLGVLTVIGYDFFAESDLFPGRQVPVYGMVLGFGFLLLFRTLVRVLRRLLFKVGFGVSDILIIGETPAALQIAEAISDTRHSGLRVLGLVGPKKRGFRSFASFSSAVKHLDVLPNGIIQTELYKDQTKNDEILAFAQENHISYRFVPGNSDLFIGNIAVELFAGLPMIAVHQTALVGWGRIIKRLFDLLVAIILLIILSPLLLLIGLLEKLFDPRSPVLFKQIRLTRFNREFTCYKFRTHLSSISGLSDQEAFAKLGKPELYKDYVRNGYVLQKDPRISLLGRFLRLTSLDELPQLLNVLKGDLSLVGPRALIPAELNTFAKKHDILSVKAGITGLAQISGREDIGFEERRRIDVYYVQNWSFWLDISILIRTLRVVLTGSGAK